MQRKLIKLLWKNDSCERLVNKMILKLIFIQTSYVILALECIDSYVLFAANIEDFRTLAKKIIPDQLADQVVDIAEKSSLNYYRKGTKNENDDEYSDESDSDESSNDYNRSSDDDSVSDLYRNPEPSTNFPVLTKKRYVIKNQAQNIDLDELVKRVKEKLEKEFKITTKTLTEDFVATTDGVPNIEDYYYKDYKLNDFNKDEESEQALTTGKQSNVATPEPNEHNIPEYFEGHAEEAAEYTDENVNEVIEDNKDTKEIPEYSKEVPVYGITESVNKVTENNNENVRDVVRFNKDNAKEVPAYYGDNAKDVAQYNDGDDNYKGEVIKDISEYYEDNTNPKDNAKSNVEVGIDTQNTQNMEPSVIKVPNLEATNMKNTNIEATNMEDTNIEATNTEPNNGEIFKEIDMLKPNDSYEDYVTPKRDDIFDSAEKPTRKPMEPIMGVQKFIATDKNEHSRAKAVADSVASKIKENFNNVVSPPPKRVTTGKKLKPELIKAKTESLWYKDPNIDNYDDSTKSTTEGSGQKATTKKRLGTMFPTKQHVKISSPNYFAKLPAVAEKYNFDEPLPEKDREPEKIKHIGNPPASINMKVKI